MSTVMRFCRRASGASLAHVASKVGVERSHLSQTELRPNVAGIDLQERLSRYYGLSWETLAKNVDPQEMTVRFVQALQAKGFV